MAFLLRSPKSNQVFSTSSWTIAKHLRLRHKWIAKSIGDEKIEDLVDTSCIIEKNDGTIEFDTKMLDHENMLEILKDTLIKDGLSEDLVDVKYEGRKKEVTPGAMDWVTQLVGGRRRSGSQRQSSEDTLVYYPLKFTMHASEMAGLTSSQDDALMPYLLYPPNSTETTKPTYAVGYPNSLDEIILQDLQTWGWKIEATPQTNPKWLSAIEEYHTRMQKPSDEDGVTWPSIWDYWREEKARRKSLGGSTVTGSRRSSLSSLIGRQKRRNLSVQEGNSCEEVVNEGVKDVHMPTRERKTIAQLREETGQVKEDSEDWNAPNPASSLGRLDENHSGIYKYENGGLTGAEKNEQLEGEIAQDIADWQDIRGILKTTQVSVRSGGGVCVDEKKNRAYFPPEPQLPLFEWEAEVLPMNSTKSNELSRRSSSDCAPNGLSGVSDIIDMTKEKHQPDQRMYRVVG